MTSPSATADVSTWSDGRAISASDLAAALGLPDPTPDQRAVIESPPVPALVVAGAGSGKTETMAGRVVWLVANGHVERDEILGLTFTRKAASELAERIGHRLSAIDAYERRGLLPHLPALVADGTLARFWERHRGDSAKARDAALAALLDDVAAAHGAGGAASALADSLVQRPRVATYNAFADAIVREHGARIGRDPDAALLSQSAAWLLARRVVVSSDDERLADREEAFTTVIDAVHRLAGDVLDHRVDLAALAQFGTEWSRRLEGIECRLAKDRDAVGRMQRAMSGLPVLADLVADYAERKRTEDVLDFADQVAGALQIVEAAPDVVRELRAQYRVVLLDEYQDTSVIQTRLLAEVFQDTAVMAVGDPHQSIYAWRGASADNLAAFPRVFARERPCVRHSLMISWRNDESVLAAANALVANADPGRMAVEPLRARPGADAGRVGHRFVATVDDEADEVARWFVGVRAGHDAEQERVASEGRENGLPAATPKAHSGAILFRTKRHMTVFADALARHGVPHRILGLGGLLSTPEVVDVVSVLRVVHDPTEGSALIRVLTGPRFAVGVADVAELNNLAQTLSRRDAALGRIPDELAARLRSSAGADEQASIVDALDFVRTVTPEHGLLKNVSAEGLVRLREAGAMLERLRRAVGQPIPELIRLIEVELRLDIELAANEARGPARLARAQLRTFLDEVRAFLLADDRGSIGSLLAWLDHAEETDELMPRAEPSEPGIVQLLTVHGAKGLEWDAVAVVRLVEKELPKAPRDLAGWLGFGVLPAPLRGDRDALPNLGWTLTDADEDLAPSIEQYKERSRSHQEAEERRLAYVAVTRARSDLLLTGSHWAGQRDPRPPSRYLVESVAAWGREMHAGDPGENPYLERGGRIVPWPLDPLGSRRAAVEAAAAEVVRADAEAEPDDVLARLLAERDLRAEHRTPSAPMRVPASRFKDYLDDYSATAAGIARPMPERPFRQTRIGTLFHAWVEQRAGVATRGPSLDDALWEIDDDLASEASTDEAEVLARLQATFERSDGASLAPREVESEIDFTLRLPDGTAHVVVCKLDAVYERSDRGGRIEIVDWKTGAPPRTAAEREQRLVQLALYRAAYHRAHGVPLERIDVALYYVATDTVVRGDAVYSEEELAQRWIAAREARRSSSSSDSLELSSVVGVTNIESEV